MSVQVDRQRRPRDRKAQIASAAAQRFRDHGYHRVGVEEIAGAAGITGRAIYRHFDTKQDLLAHIVFAGLARVDDACDGGSLQEVLASLAAVVVRERHLGVLLQRETRNLAPGDQETVTRRIDAIAARLVGLVRFERPDLKPDEAEFLSRCALSVLASPSHHNIALPDPAAERLLASMAATALAAPVRPSDAVPGAQANGVRASRREAVLGAAIELFSRRGYGAVRMEDVGAAAGIAGPSIYEHFTGKADLLMAALTRGAEALQLGLTGALVAGDAPEVALERVVRSYYTSTLGHRDLMRVLLREAVNLSDVERATLRRVQHEYLSEWVRLVAVVRPELSDGEAWFVTHGGVSVINETIEATRRFDLVGVCMALLLGGDSP